MKRKKFTCWLSAIFGILILVSTFLLSRKAVAMPQFARRYKVSCHACHTIPPVLNQQGYMFKRLGHHLPPALEVSHTPSKLSELVEKEPEWTLTNNAALAVSDFSFSSQRTTQQGQSPSSTSAFQVSAWNAYFSGWIPNTNFFYLSELDIVMGGQTSPDMPNAHIGYVGGNAKNSWYGTVGREHLQVSEGTRASQVYSFLPNAPLLFENMGPTNFLLDQSPVGAEVGYTWASSNYRNILGVNFKVTNGDNADGSEILGASNKNGKDIWADADWWYAPESGVSFVTYQGRKQQFQNSGLPNQFSFNSHISRTGVFGNYMVGRDKVDLLGGYLHGNDDWEDPTTAAAGSYVSNGYFTEIDYYVRRGLVLAGRYDRLNQNVTGITKTKLEQWQVGVEKAFTSSGNIVGRASAGNFHGPDPLSLVGSSTKTYQADIQFNF